MFLVCSSDRSIVRPIVHGSFVRSSDRSIVRLFVRPNNLCSAVTLFIVTICHCYYSLLLFIIFTIHRCYLSSLFIVHRYCSSDPPNFNCSSIMLSSSPKTFETNILVIRTPVTVIFLPVRTFHLVTHPEFLQVEHA
jgi:hypothetical protein